MENSIGRLVKKVNKFKNSKFDAEIERRIDAGKVQISDANKLLEHLSNLIAYSQQAQSTKVTDVIDSGSLQEAFCNFDIAKVAKLNPCDVVDTHWNNIKGIRQQTKIFQIIMLARRLRSNESISKLLLSSKIPKELHNLEDYNTFWQEFRILKSELKDTQVPFFRETTSLLHLLVSLGHDCVKPDSAVMKAAIDMGMVSKRSGENNLVKVVQTIQNYSIENSRALPPPALDLYFLVCGGQTDAQKYVSSQYYNA